MKFLQFRLATLLRLRVAVRDERRQQVAESFGSAEALKVRRDEIDRELAELKRRQAAPAVAVDIEGLRDADRYEALLREERRQVDARRRTLDIEIEKRREAIFAADRDVRALEQLRDTHDQRRRAEDERRTMKELDEVALRRHEAAAR